MRFAYADPPYPGQASRHYGDDPDSCEVNLPILVGHLDLCYPDGWALSTGSKDLAAVLPLLAGRPFRTGAWVKPFCGFKPGVNPAYAWEPVLFRGGRSRGRGLPTVRDWCSVNVTAQQGTVGAKPRGFWQWLFAMLGASPADGFADLFPGSGAGAREWAEWCATYRALSVSFDTNRARSLCPCGCGVRVSAGKRGRPRCWASDACKSRAYRRRVSS